jgi:hypothetical protein
VQLQELVYHSLNERTGGAKLALADIQDESLEKVFRKKSPQYKGHPVEPKLEILR